MDEKQSYYYETEPEYYEGYDMNYVSYGIYTREKLEKVEIYHDVSLNYKEAHELCVLLNSNALEPEQAKYIVEDYILEKYLVNP